MKRKSADTPRLPAKAVTYEQKSRALETARNAGHLLLVCGRALSGQTITINPEDETDTHYWFDWLQPNWSAGEGEPHINIFHGHISEVSYQGVRRREGLLRRSVDLDISPEAISAGDRIILDVAGLVSTSLPVTQIETAHDIGVARERLALPRLAFSSE